MYHVECIDIHKDDILFSYADRASLCANNMYNVANFYIRNLMTGLKKEIRLRTENENFVIGTVTGSISGINDSLRDKYERKVRRGPFGGGACRQDRKGETSSVFCSYYGEVVCFLRAP